MAKLAAIIAALSLVEANKPLVDELKAETVGLAGDVEIKELVTRLNTSEAQNAEFTTQIKTLGADAQAGVVLKARVAALETEKRDVILRGHFAMEATKNGIHHTAIATAFKLTDTSKLTVDLEKKTVEGLSAELFAGLKTEHAILFTPPVVVIDPAKPIPATPANGGTVNAGSKISQADITTGRFDPKEIISGKVTVEN